MSRQPDYKKIYTDIIRMKYPEKEAECKKLLDKKKLSAFDVLALNDKIFGKKNNSQRHRSYSKADIFGILDYQKANKLNNTQLAAYFNLSRNTVTKWRKIFVV